MTRSALYDSDFYAWAIEHGGLVARGKAVGRRHRDIGEEIESMGKTEKRELVSRLKILLLRVITPSPHPAAFAR